jgi:hypothetical protein
MSHFNVNNNHPIISNSNDYFLIRKHISIHSEDRDITKYPESSEFEIELPQDYLNVNSMRLVDWSFPSNYNVFSEINNNVQFFFKIMDPYDPSGQTFDTTDEQIQVQNIYNGLVYLSDYLFELVIETGFYNPTQMATELTNKMNMSVTIQLINYFKNNSIIVSSSFSYNRFVVVYNEVNQKFWFGNSADNFMFNNSSSKYIMSNMKCIRKDILPDYSNWGLPYNLGFLKKDVYAIVSPNYLITPRFYYGDILKEDDNGVWLTPSEPNSNIYFIEPSFKINLMGTSYIYLDITGYNCLDETSPYNLSKFTTHTNETNGIVNSSFAKIPVLSTPISQWYDQSTYSYKYFNPPAERIRKLKLKLRYHNGQSVNFGYFDFSITLEFNLLTPQSQRSYNIRDSYDLGQLQSK